MNFILVVVRPFGPYAVGDRITAATDMTAILASDHRSAVVQVTPPTSATAEH